MFDIATKSSKYILFAWTPIFTEKNIPADPTIINISRVIKSLILSFTLSSFLYFNLQTITLPQPKNPVNPIAAEILLPKMRYKKQLETNLLSGIFFL